MDAWRLIGSQIPAITRSIVLTLFSPAFIFLSLHPTSISSPIIIVLSLVPLTSSVGTLSVLVVYFRTTKWTYGQWLVYGELVTLKSKPGRGVWISETSWFTIDSVSWHFPIHNWLQLLQNHLDSLLTTLLGSTSLSLSMSFWLHWFCEGLFTTAVSFSATIIGSRRLRLITLWLLSLPSLWVVTAIANNFVAT
jgi:hypothetical protein